MHRVMSIELQDADHLLVQIGDDSRTGNLYYLGIGGPDGDTGLSAATGVHRLITSWIRTIQVAPVNQLFYLPFDFSDEFTRWIACQKNGSDLDCVFGWAAVEGWSISPLDFGEQAFGLEAFHPDDPVQVQTIYRPALLSGLRSSQARLREAED